MSWSVRVAIFAAGLMTAYTAAVHLGDVGRWFAVGLVWLATWNLAQVYSESARDQEVPDEAADEERQRREQEARRREQRARDEAFAKIEAHYRMHVQGLRDEMTCKRCGQGLVLDFVHGVPVWQCPAHGAAWRSHPKATRE